MLGWLFGKRRAANSNRGANAKRRTANSNRGPNAKRRARPAAKERAATLRNLNGGAASHVLARLGDADALSWAMAYKADNPARDDPRVREPLEAARTLRAMARTPHAVATLRVGGEDVRVEWQPAFAPKDTFVYEFSGPGTRWRQETLLKKLMLPHKAMSQYQHGRHVLGMVGGARARSR